MSRASLLKKLIKEQNMSIPPKLSYIFEQNIPENIIDEFIKKESDEELQNLEKEKEELYTELFKLDALDWGGLYQNGLEKTIVNNYVKKIKNYDELVAKITNKLNHSMSGYVRSSWYNNWSSILIESMFRGHEKILPAIGKVYCTKSRSA